MTAEPTGDDLLGHVDVNRRRFVGRLVVGSAIAAPVVSSFSMRGVNAVFAQDTNVSGNGQVGSGTVDRSSTTSTTAANTTSTTAGNVTTTTAGNVTTTTAGNTTSTTAGNIP